VLDDECSDNFLIKTLLRLKKEAKKNGGDILIIAGNHEIMNILSPENERYTSDQNISINREYFNDKEFINEYIRNSYAWIKINDILITHGGLCSDYLKYLDEFNVFDNKIYGGGNVSDKYLNKLNLININGGKPVETGNDIITFINKRYKTFFTDFDKTKLDTDNKARRLFLVDETIPNNNLNMFWCREWGQSGVDCDKFKDILLKIDCTKMIIAHCPQFIPSEFPKMINFECLDNDDNFNIARIDLGMSRSFDYNVDNGFLNNLSTNYNRKMSILKLKVANGTNKLYFDKDSIITEKLSCLQYLLAKYGITKEEWEQYKITSNWIGFDYIYKLIGQHIKHATCSCKPKKYTVDKNTFIQSYECNTKLFEHPEIILCLLEPIVHCKKSKLKSVVNFLKANKHYE
jgi:hypothetical protein